jgi:hypothetical protein
MATGKIARLPRQIRNQLSQRLDDGEGGNSLLEWLNGLPEVKKLCDEQFHAVPVSKQNLSDFKQGPHQEWLRGREACELAQHLAEQADDLGRATDEANVSEVLGRVFAVELARLARTMLAETADPQERWRRLREVLGQVARLRTGDHQWQRLQIERERRKEEQGRRAQEQQEKNLAKAKQQATGALWAGLMQGPLAEALGGGEKRSKMAELMNAMENDLPLPPTAAPAPNGQTQSSPVKDSQG